MGQCGSRRVAGALGAALLAGSLALAGCSSNSPKGGGTVPPLNSTASGASASTGATTSSTGAPSASPSTSSTAGGGPVTAESMSDPDLGYTVVSIPESLDATQTEVLRAYFTYDRATWRLWTKDEGLDTIDDFAEGEALRDIHRNATNKNGELTRPPIRISVSEVIASADGNGYSVSSCLDLTQATFIDGQGKDITTPSRQSRFPSITFMNKGEDGRWRATREEIGQHNTCNVN
ncbi:hypothetical protein [Actinomyces sp. ZJ308]|uniref:hypothetical protein n=1 Tax=Actinomyces sp. ZJ308 TaxID=2708342 RepID=UPI00141EA128|nr:hypothetical protein [Actinomyces sp. ZJ308]